jgi:hypothetical protein
MNDTSPNLLAEKLLLAVKMSQDTSELQSTLAAFPLASLKSGLDSDEKKKAFWINVYNAYYQILRMEKGMNKPAIYRERSFVIAGEHFSLDDAEHGILRQLRYKKLPPYLAPPNDTRLIENLAVAALDYRIHFALNCGAKSCPPIAFYRVDSLEEQLNLATQSFLEGETDFNDEQKIISTTALFEWFADDFGGEDGIRKIYLDQLKKDVTGYSIKYKEYSWEDALGNFV